MKKNNWSVGIPYSGIISFIGSFPMLLRFSASDLPRFLHSVCFYFIFSLLCWMLFQQLIQSSFIQSRKNKTKWYYLTCLVIILAVSFSFDFFNYLFTRSAIQVIETHSAYQRHLMVVFKGVLMGGLSSFIIYHLDVLKEKQSSALELERLKRGELIARMSSLKEQLSPHFLFNSLNSLKSLIKKDTNKSVEFVVELSQVYRYLLQHHEHESVSLKEELEFIEAYIFLVKARFGENVVVDVEIPEQYQNSRIPPVTLQLLLENAVKHNIVSSARPLNIRIFIDGDSIFVTNDYQPKNSVENSGQVGLSNMDMRYRLLAKRGIRIRQDDSRFVVELPIIHNNESTDYRR